MYLFIYLFKFIIIFIIIRFQKYHLKLGDL